MLHVPWVLSSMHFRIFLRSRNGLNCILIKPSSSFSTQASQFSHSAKTPHGDRDKYSQEKHRQILYSKLKVASEKQSGGGKSMKVAEDIYEEIKKAHVGMTVPAFNNLIYAAGTMGAAAKALSYYNDLKKLGLKPNEQTFNFMLRAYANSSAESALDRILWLKDDEMPRFGVELTRPLATIFLQGLIEHFGQPDHGLKLLQEIQEKQIVPDLSLYSSVIRFFGSQGDETRMKAVWDELCAKFQPDTRAYNTYLRALLHANATESAKRVLHQFSINRKSNANAAGPDAFTAAIALKICKRDEEVVELVSRSLREWQVIPDVPLVHALLGEVSRRPNLCADLLPRIYGMIRENRLTPNSETYALLIGAFGRARESDTALKLYDEMKEKGYRPKKSTFTSLLAACMNAKPPRIERAFHALEEMRAQNIELDEVLLKQIRRLAPFVNENAGWKKAYETLTGESAPSRMKPFPSSSKPSPSSSTNLSSYRKRPPAKQ